MIHPIAVPQTPEKHTDLRGSFVWEGVTVNPPELASRYADSSDGRQQAKRTVFPPGYDYYGDRPAIIDELGPGVDPIGRLEHTHSIAVALLEMQRNTPGAMPIDTADESAIRTASVLAGVGYNPKDPERTVDVALLEKHFPDLPTSLIAKVLELDKGEQDEIAVFAFAAIKGVVGLNIAQNARQAIIDDEDPVKKAEKDKKNPVPASFSFLARTSQLARRAIIGDQTYRTILQPHADDFPYVAYVLTR